MKKHSGNVKGPVILLHGGVSMVYDKIGNTEEKSKRIGNMAKASFGLIKQGKSAEEIVSYALELLEADPYFNAGFGSTLQCDGSARLSASLMSGEKQQFSGVSLARFITHPSKISLALQEKMTRLVGPQGAELVAREIGLPVDYVVTPERAKEWVEFLEEHGENSEDSQTGTVGAVVLTADGKLAAGTSTGGRGIEYPDRMSDVSSVAGNYASKHCAISCSGVGEQIIDDGVALRTETRVRDGLDIIEASNKAFSEAEDRSRKYGWIGIDKNGNWIAYHTTQYMSLALMSSDEQDFWAQ